MGKYDLCNDGSCPIDKTIKVSFCPRCKSSDVKYVFGLWNLFGAIPKMRCGKCGIEMPSFPLLITSKKLLAASDNGKKTRRKKK
jgi:hypothetical protein